MTEISSLIRLTESSIRPKLPNGVALNAVLGATECNVDVDQNHLGQALMNLLANACKFTEKGAITFGYELFDNEINFYVKDTGCGLTPEVKARLADLFDNDDTASPGLGLGLPVTNTIVKRLGGQIGAESRGAGRGSNFWFTIPYSGNADEQEGAEAETPASDEVKPDRLTILVAEDVDSNYLLVHTVLKRQYNVFRAVDGLQAVEEFKRLNPDIILMDIFMPRMDGYEAVREIRRYSATVPIIALTAYAFVTDSQRLREQGFNGYVSKPINLNRLEQEINRCLANAEQ